MSAFYNEIYVDVLKVLMVTIGIVLGNLKNPYTD